ncbi:hypothetical protein LCGC14_1533650 [marine sediment metagenome]|uniref:HEPN domain-containing protein n=1 Tax=marine sediment metagenome TaxID=412755 RepID=A0A0F9LAX4_9ZZZZ
MKIEVRDHDVITLADATAEMAKVHINSYEWDEARECIDRAQELLAMLPPEEQGDAE